MNVWQTKGFPGFIFRQIAEFRYQSSRQIEKRVISCRNLGKKAHTGFLFQSENKQYSIINLYQEWWSHTVRFIFATNEHKNVPRVIYHLIKNMKPVRRKLIIA